jgi:predicted nucleic acid-binding protein
LRDTPLDLSDLREGALLLLDSSPIIYLLESHPEFRPRFEPLFERHAEGGFRFAITTVTIAEVLTGPLAVGDEILAARYRSILESWMVVDLNAGIAEATARFRSQFRLELADAVQVASAIAINADALVTHDRDFSSVTVLRVIS